MSTKKTDDTRKAGAETTAAGKQEAGAAGTTPAQVAELARAGEAFERQVEDQVRAKMRAGLTREQALQVIRAQIADDERQRRAG